MSMHYISDAARKIKKKYQEKDPFKLANAMGIIIHQEAMGTSSNACKGFFMVECRKPIIVVNSDLPNIIQNIIVMHEIGHAVLHRHSLQISCFHDFELFDNVSKCEYEANSFAAEYLLDDDEVLQKLNADLSFFQSAAELNVPPELLDFKFRMMKRNGVQIVDSPITSDSNFLKDISTADIYDNYF